MKTFIVISALIAFASAASPYKSVSSNEDVILKQSADVDPSGKYQFEYETSNGVHVAESGVGGQYAQGDARWYAPDGTPVNFQYVADENGYQPTGSHLPQAPAVPEQIARALEYIRTHPPKENENGQYYVKAVPF